MKVSEREFNTSEQARQNMSYIVGLYGATIKILLDEIESPSSATYRESLTRLANKTLKKGEAIFKVHGEKPYEQVLEELELLLQMP